MKYNQLKTGFKTLAMAVSVGLLAVACNNGNDSANNSTNGESNADSAGKMTNSTPAVAKKKGRASSAMAADDMKADMKMDKEGYYNRTEVAPMYEGGQSSLDNYINDNIEYPQDAIDNNIEGTVNVQFAVDDKGNISHVTTVGNKIGYGLEEEAVKVVSNMPRWTPGQVKGKNVKTWRLLPIKYQLES